MSKGGLRQPAVEERVFDLNAGDESVLVGVGRGELRVVLRLLGRRHHPAAG